MSVIIKRAYANVPLGQIHYRHAGVGKPLLLLHQTATSSAIYEPIMRLLAPVFSMIAMDTPGFGVSDYPPSPYTIADYAQVVEDFLDALQISSCSVFGHHTGASIACELAARAPSRVEKLILSGAACFDETEGKARLARIPRMILQEDGSHMTAVWNYMAPLTQVGGSTLDLATRHREVANRLTAGPRMYEAYTAVFSYDMASRLPLIEAPTLVMAGEYDTLRVAVGPTTALLKNARPHIVPGGANYILLQKPDQVATLVRSFLSNP